MTLRDVEFRDGARTIPEHLAIRMAGLDTTTMTYKQAVSAANSADARRFLNNLQAKVVAEHMRNLHR